MHPQSTPFERRFWSKVNRKGPLAYPGLGHCWLWTGRVDKWGYGVLKHSGSQRPYLAHRVAWEISTGPIPSGLWCLHRCDSTGCVRPSHLYLGTPADNVRDREARGRGVPPPGGGVLTVEQRQEIRRRYAQGGVTHKTLGVEYGVTTSSIGYLTRKDRRSLDRGEGES